VTWAEARRPHTTPPFGMTRLALRFALCAVLPSGVVTSASGQAVQGWITDLGSDEPVAGAMVTLLDRQGREDERSLTHADGYFVVTASSPGEFRVRIDRIGYATTFSRFVHLSERETVALRVAAAPEPVSLQDIEVTADRRECRLRPEEGLAVAKVWEEARKALAAAVWTQDRGLYRYETLRVRREFDEAGWRVESENRSYGQSLASAPYVARSADSLVAHGFVEISPTGIVFWAPDAEVLLSDAFLDSHCVALVPDGEDLDAIGVAFEPVERGGVPDIAGTMWLDRRTARLRRVDFSFVDLNVPPWLLEAEPGGSVEFVELSNGAWIVPSWQMRMFRAGDGGTHPLTGRPYPTLEGVTAHSGRVLRAYQGDEVVFEGGAGMRITGTVRDSLGAGLANARVFLPGSGAQATTDTSGYFELDHLVPGEYTLRFTHSYLDSLGYQPEPANVIVQPQASEPAQVFMDAPPLREVLERICESASPPKPMMTIGTPPRLTVRAGMLIGHVRDDEGTPVEDAQVVVMPQAYEVAALMDPKKARAVAVGNFRSWTIERTAISGFYRVCWVPVDVPFEVAVFARADLDESRLEEAVSLRDAFPGRRIESFTIDRQSPHRSLDLTTRSGR